MQQEISPQYLAGVIDALAEVRSNALALKTPRASQLKDMLGGLGYATGDDHQPRDVLLLYYDFPETREALTGALPHLRVLREDLGQALDGNFTRTTEEVVCQTCYEVNGNHSTRCPERVLGSDPGNEDWAERVGYTASASSPVPETAEESEPDPLDSLKYPEDTDDPAECRFCYLTERDVIEGDRCSTHQVPSDEELVQAVNRRERSGRPRGERGRDRARQGVA